MSTRSIIAANYPDGVKGRYCHSDGYPSWNGVQIYAIATRDGLEGAAYRLLEEHYGWSSLQPTGQPSLGLGYTDGRFAAVEGYGVAYTTKDGQSDPEEWLRPTDLDSWCEWAYVIGAKGLEVHKIVSPVWTHITTVPWGLSPEDAAEAMSKAEEKGYQVAEDAYNARQEADA